MRKCCLFFLLLLGYLNKLNWNWLGALTLSLFLDRKSTLKNIFQSSPFFKNRLCMSFLQLRVCKPTTTTAAAIAIQYKRWICANIYRKNDIEIRIYKRLIEWGRKPLNAHHIVNKRMHQMCALSLALSFYRSLVFVLFCLEAK